MAPRRSRTTKEMFRPINIILSIDLRICLVAIEKMKVLKRYNGKNKVMNHEEFVLKIIRFFVK
jgi:hypothetical protein